MRLTLSLETLEIDSEFMKMLAPFLEIDILFQSLIVRTAIASAELSQILLRLQIFAESKTKFLEELKKFSLLQRSHSIS